jgi:hypothetical protein
MIELPPQLAGLLLDSVADGLALIDETGAVAWANAAFIARLGSSRDACCGKSIDALDPSGKVTEGLILKDLLPVGIEAQLARLPAQDNRLDTSQIGLLSRGTALQRMDLEISRSRRYGNPLSCMLIALPESASPEQLTTLARFLREQLRWVDLTARWDELTLLVLLPETSAASAGELGRKLEEQAQSQWPEGRFEWTVGTWQRGDDALGLVVRARRGDDGLDAPLRAQAIR